MKEISCFKEVENFVELVYKVGFEMVGTITLERRLGALEKSNPQTTLILDSIKGYQSSSNEAMYGLPWWKYLPDGCSGKIKCFLKFTMLFHYLITRRRSLNQKCITKNDEIHSFRCVYKPRKTQRHSV